MARLDADQEQLQQHLNDVRNNIASIQLGEQQH